MTLILKGGVEVKTYPQSTGLHMRIGDTHLPIEEFFAAAFYALINSDLADGDVRTKFVEAVKKLEVVEAFSKGSTKLQDPGINDPFTTPF